MDLILLPITTLHLLAANIAAAGPLFAAWLGHRSRSREAAAGAVGLQLAQLSLGALVVLVATGVAQVFAPGREALFSAAARFPSRDLWIACAEVLFSLVMTLLLLAAWRGSRFRTVLAWSAAVLTASNLLYHFPPLMLVLARLKADSLWTTEREITRAVFRGLMTRGEVVSLTVHFGLASVAVAAVAALWLEARQRAFDTPSDSEQPKRSKIGQAAALVAGGVTAVQFPIGLWVLVSSPTATFNALAGGSPLHALAFASGIVASLLLLQRLAAYVLDGQTKAAANNIAVVTAAVVALMTLTLGAK
ncbi:MAG: hypothetical protein AAGA92_05480 [Planctomycetota bacterium]